MRRDGLETGGQIGAGVVPHALRQLFTFHDVEIGQRHGTGYRVAAVGVAVALANLDIMESEQLPQRVRDDTGPYLARCFESIADHPLVGIAETCGLTAGLVLVKNKQDKTLFAEELGVGMMCRRHCFQNGLIMRAVGDRMIIAPPLTMTHAEIDEMMRLIRLALDLTHQELSQKGLI
jgi:putrescine aminotransferase